MHYNMAFKKMSRIAQLLECLYDWTEKMENSAETNVIDLHFSKAFDIVHHK